MSKSVPLHKSISNPFILDSLNGFRGRASSLQKLYKEKVARIQIRAETWRKVAAIVAVRLAV